VITINCIGMNETYVCNLRSNLSGTGRAILIIGRHSGNRLNVESHLMDFACQCYWT